MGMSVLPTHLPTVRDGGMGHYYPTPVKLLVVSS
jgi:hypothetical protein